MEIKGLRLTGRTHTGEVFNTIVDMGKHTLLALKAFMTLIFYFTEALYSVWRRMPIKLKATTVMILALYILWATRTIVY